MFTHNPKFDKMSTKIGQIFNFDDYIKKIMMSDIDKLASEDCPMECAVVENLTTDFTSKLVIKDVSKKYVIAIDNDECIGSWADLSLIYAMFKSEQSDQEPDINLFVDIMVSTVCVRPYVKEFFENLLELKKKNIIHKIFMFTAASNSTGWVSFLSKVLEKWIGEKLYDGIIYGELIEDWHLFNSSDVCNNVGYVKNMNMIREIIDFEYEIKSEEYDVIAIDDRPENIINGIAIKVTPYTIAINILEVMRLYLPDKSEYLMAKYEKCINQSWEKYMRNPHIYTKVHLDRDIFNGMELINKIIFNE